MYLKQRHKINRVSIITLPSLLFVFITNFMYESAQLFSGKSNGAILLCENCYSGIVNTVANPVSPDTQHNFGID
jgi:hypothetical protein